MIREDGKILRNLQEQVLENQSNIQDILEGNQILSQFGIRVVGQVETAEDLPTAETYEGSYGDAYLVGTETPYDYYIWTRPTTTIQSAHWLNIGEFPMPGPQGPQGEQGPEGPQGEASKWYVQSANPSSTSGYKNGDVWLNVIDGAVFWLVNGYWARTGTIKGPQGDRGAIGPRGAKGSSGPQGPKGDTGDVGGFINIAGQIASTDLLPTPQSLQNLTIAYLVGDDKNLYIQVGSTSSSAVWTNMGPLNVATYVTVNGLFQNTWDADTKLDKASGTSTYDQAYMKKQNGEQYMIDMAVENPRSESLVGRDTNGKITASNHQRALGTSTDNYALNGCSLRHYAAITSNLVSLCSDTVYKHVTSEDDWNGNNGLLLEMSINGDPDPIWQIDFTAGSDCVIGLENNFVKWLRKDELVSGTAYTLIFYPMFIENMSEYTAGTYYDDVVYGILAAAEA